MRPAVRKLVSRWNRCVPPWAVWVGQAGALLACALYLAGCQAGREEIPLPPGSDAFKYLLTWLEKYGGWGILAGLLLLFFATLFNKAFAWVSERFFQRVVTAHDEWQSARQRERQLDTATQAYIDHVLAHYTAVNLRGIRSSQPFSLELEDIYIPLSTLRPMQELNAGDDDEEARRLPVRERPFSMELKELLPRCRRLVILGSPGAGKTTFLSYLALTYARHLDGRWPRLMRERLGFEETLVPLLLPLRDLARHIRVRYEEGVVEAGPAVLLDFIRRHFAQWNLPLPEDFFPRLLDEGRCLVMLDGLDEVADYDERVFVREIIEAFVARYPRNRYLVTCRAGGYHDAARLASGFVECHIRDFDGEDVRRFAQVWHLAVEAAAAGGLNDVVRQRAEKAAQDFLHAVDSNPRIRALAINPLMLTVIALVHRYRATLPQRRVELYDECTELLLGHWDMGKEGEEAKWLAEWAGMDIPLDPAEKRSLLEPVARWYHEHRLLSADAHQVEELLTQRLAQLVVPAQPAVPAHSRQRARAFLQFLDERSGLFREWEAGRYAFTHLTFQEYLTARDVAAGDDYVATVLRHLDDSWWRETILLTAAHLSTTSRSRASQLVRAILAAGVKRGTRWWPAVILAGECLVDIGKYRVDAQLWQDVVDGLVWIVEHDGVPLADRLRAAGVLGELGDPRLGQTVTVPGGDIIVASNGRIHRLFVERFEIDRLPVTNAQFAEFIQSGGYRTREYWSEEGWQFIQSKGIRAPRFWDDPMWNRPNYPVVGVSWYEAEAYARWAGGALPTELQWLKAAGWEPETGRVRRWPWGDEWKPDTANTAELRLERTTPAGLFPGGASPCGALDMIGNVWEWCANVYAEGSAGNGTPSRALRGGSWCEEMNLANVAGRDRALPTAREADIGFRLVWIEK